MGIHIVHELIRLGVAANMVGRITAGDHHAIEIRGPRVIVRELRFHRVAEFAAVSFACFGADGYHRGARLLKAE